MDDRLKKALRNTREMVICFKKISVISDLVSTSNSDTLAFIPSTLMQVMTLERYVPVTGVCMFHTLISTFALLLLLFLLLLIVFVFDCNY